MPRGAWAISFLACAGLMIGTSIKRKCAWHSRRWQRRLPALSISRRMSWRCGASRNKLKREKPPPQGSDLCGGRGHNDEWRAPRMSQREDSKLAPNGKQSLRKNFESRIARIQLEELESGPDLEFDPVLFRRFCIDDRMQPVWKLLAGFDDVAFDNFLCEVIVRWEAIKR